MTTQPHEILRPVPTKDIDDAVRERIRAWLLYYLTSREWTQVRLAREVGIAPSTLNAILSRDRTAGFDVAIKMHRGLKRSLDDLIDIDPPATAIRGGARGTPDSVPTPGRRIHG